MPEPRNLKHFRAYDVSSCWPCNSQKIKYVNVCPQPDVFPIPSYAEATNNGQFHIELIYAKNLAFLHAGGIYVSHKPAALTIINVAFRIRRHNTLARFRDDYTALDYIELYYLA